MVIGLILGVLIGIVSGIVFLLLLRSAHRLPDQGVSAILTLTGELLAIPAFWFGGPWLTTKLLQQVPLDTILNPYLTSLVITFGGIVVYPAFRWIVQIGEDWGKRG